jgi:glycosyltransferase involved in cell wall biosynthesis
MVVVSVIMPCYDRVDFLRESIASVLMQSFDDLELIIVDNNCPGDVVEIISSYDDVRVKCVYQPVQGVYHAIEAGLNVASGYYVYVMGSDDLLDVKFFEVMINGFNAKLDSCRYCYFDRLEPDGRRIPILSVGLAFINTVMSKWFLDQVRDYQGTYFNLRLKRQADEYLFNQLRVIGKVRIVDQNLAVYRWHGKNFSSVPHVWILYDEIVVRRQMGKDMDIVEIFVKFVRYFAWTVDYNIRRLRNGSKGT